MSGIGFAELVILFLIGLIVLGPERLPRVASQLGSWLGQARRMTRVMKRQLEDELNLEKELSIAPPVAATAAGKSGAEKKEQDDTEKSDTFSPAHGSDDVGTGVGDDETPDDARSDDESVAEETPDESETPVTAKEQVS